MLLLFLRLLHPRLSRWPPQALATRPPLPRPSVREILMNELRAPKFWTDLPAELRKLVARLPRKLLCMLRDARDTRRTASRS
jgi:hypothetical protein